MFILNMNGFRLNMVGLVLNMTIFFLNQLEYFQHVFLVKVSMKVGNEVSLFFNITR